MCDLVTLLCPHGLHMTPPLTLHYLLKPAVISLPPIPHLVRPCLTFIAYPLPLLSLSSNLSRPPTPTGLFV